MLCKFRLRSLMASMVLLLVVLTTLTEAASTEKGSNNKRKEKYSRTRRNTKYMLELENLTWSSHNPRHNWEFINASFNNRSLSPWIYKEDTDANRYPSTIFKAECVYSQCLSSRGVQDPSLNTHLVHQEMIVLKKSKGPEHRIIYHAEKMMVPVACVCVRPVVTTS
ncbi:interleukin-17A-like [Rhincodon typus]|uniref:interleukin-17A-like n=1 Tax=Rhincodon typus TaxID=259920 RepID=UPI0020307765|nr:interleukin-17A-like [Rhincodon typus]